MKKILIICCAIIIFMACKKTQIDPNLNFPYSFSITDSGVAHEYYCKTGDPNFYTANPTQTNAAGVDSLHYEIATFFTAPQLNNKNISLNFFLVDVLDSVTRKKLLPQNLLTTKQAALKNIFTAGTSYSTTGNINTAPHFFCIYAPTDGRVFSTNPFNHFASDSIKITSSEILNDGSNEAKIIVKFDYDIHLQQRDNFSNYILPAKNITGKVKTLFKVP